MGALVAGLINIFKFHKLKIAATVFFTALFGILLFPLSDLGGVLPATIHAQTGGVYVQFEQMGLNLFPFGVSLDQVQVELPGRAPIEAGHIDASPWILGALTAKTGGSVDAQDLFGGIVVADYREGDKAKGGNRIANIAVDAQGVQLPQLAKFLRDSQMLGLSMLGTVNLSTQAQIDALFGQQPAADIDATFTGFSIPNQTMEISQGPDMPPMKQPIPEIKFGNAKLAAKVGGGNINISEFSFGSAKDSVAGKVRGQIGFTMVKVPNGARPQMGTVDLNIDITMKQSFLDSDSTIKGIVDGFLQRYGSPTQGGMRYTFNMKQSPGMVLPQFSAIQ
ncbi:MAG: type II secretion system protein GspN [Bdellovibrionota bacterium]